MRVILATVSLLLFACGDNAVELGETPVPTTATPPLSATPTPEPATEVRCMHSDFIFSLTNTPTLDELFAAAKGAARVRLKDISVVSADVADFGHTGTIEFDLEVLEWLTGDGPSEFTAEVSVGSTCTYLHRKDREVTLTALSIGLKTLWYRAGEAILFLGDLGTQPYSLGYLGQIDNGGLVKHKFSEPILLWNIS